MMNKKKDALPGEMKGIYGEVRACHAVTEAQARGSLHMHLLLWAKYGPLFHSNHLHTEKGRKIIAEYMDSKKESIINRLYVYGKFKVLEKK